MRRQGRQSPEGARQPIVRVLGIAVDADQVDSWSQRTLEDQPPSPESVEKPEAVGRTLGEFEILSQIGRGGMGVVHRVWQPSLGRQVALKSLVRTGDAQSEARFGREIRALGRVEHPHLIKVFTSRVDEDQWFYAMELIQGADLTRISDELVGADASTLGDNQWRQAITTALEKARSGEETVAGAGVNEQPS